MWGETWAKSPGHICHRTSIIPENYCNDAAQSLVMTTIVSQATKISRSDGIEYLDPGVCVHQQCE